MLPIEQIRPENVLILFCIQKWSDSERTEQIRNLIKRGIDWSYLIQASLRHGLLPLLYKTLEATCSEEVPSDIFDRLRDYFRSNTLQNLAMAGELLNLMHLFKTNGIPAIPYRGPALAVLVYGDISYRQFVDLDIMVHKQDVLRAKELLISQGYQSEFHLTETVELAYLHSNCEYNFYSSSKGIQIEIHWDFLPNYFSFPLDLGRCWGRLKTIALLNKEVLTFCQEDLLLILIAHYGYKHRWERLSWIYDVSKLVEMSDGIALETVLRQGGQMGIKRAILLGLFLAEDLIGTGLPKNVLKTIEAEPVIKKLTARVYKKLFYEVDNPAGIFKDQLLYLKMRERFKDKARYVLYLTFTPNTRDWKLLPLPGPLFPLYYILRPIRLLTKYGAKLLRIISK
jgi:hypothetical protein